MKRNDTYNTKQKELILDIIKKQKKEFTVKDIYNETKNKTGLTTVYRLIDKLIEEGIIKKTIEKDNKTKYQYLEKCEEKNHFYLKCKKCKSMQHVDCDCINELSNHILKKHEFSADNENIIIGGICKNCQKGLKYEKI